MPSNKIKLIVPLGKVSVAWSAKRSEVRIRYRSKLVLIAMPANSYKIVVVWRI